MFFRRLKAVSSIILGCVCLLTAIVGFSQETFDVEISITKSDAVQLTGLEDWMIGVYGPGDRATGVRAPWDFTCAHSTTGTYNLEISTVNAGTAFHLESASGQEVPYRIIVRSLNSGDSPSGGLFRQVFTTASTLTNRLASPTPSCIGHGFRQDSNLRFRAFVSAGAFNAAVPGIYTDTVLLTISPN